MAPRQSQHPPIEEPAATSRRSFLRVTGAGVAGAAVLPGTLPARPARRRADTSRWGFLIDLRRCVGCQACTVSCKTENNVGLGGFRCTVIQKEVGTFPDVTRAFLPVLCNHCANPPCLKRCPTKVVQHTWRRPDGTTGTFEGKAATYQRPDGLVLLDQEACYGCGMCIKACPYEARFFDPHVKAGAGPAKGRRPAANKCTLCAHRLDAGIIPSCVNTCQSEARVMGDLNDPDSKISRTLAANKDRVRVLKTDEGTDPHCYYILPEGLDLDLDLVFEEGESDRVRVKLARQKS